MTRKSFIALIAAAALGTGAFAPLPANAGDGIVTIPVGNAEICVGLISCLFSEKQDGGRRTGGVADHRAGSTRKANGVADHRSGGTPSGTNGRDTASGGTGPTVRDHRTVVRDHRSQRQNEVVPVSGQTYDCRTGAVILQRMGYRSIQAYDCVSPTYHYMAQDDAALFRAEFNAHSGDINVTFIGLAN